MNAHEYTLALASALKLKNLTHSCHNVMIAVVSVESEKGFATIPRVCLALSCTYQCVMQHFMKNPDLFRFEPGHIPRRYHLTPAAIQLLADIKKRVDMIGNQARSA